MDSAVVVFSTCSVCKARFPFRPFPVQNEDGAFVDQDVEARCLDFMDFLDGLNHADGEAIMEGWIHTQKQRWAKTCLSCWKAMPQPLELLHSSE